MSNKIFLDFTQELSLNNFKDKSDDEFITKRDLVVVLETFANLIDKFIVENSKANK